jgi:DNA helicase-2/ATP-dependent DNA helicase PcrA
VSRLERPADLRDVLGIAFTDEQLAAATAPLAPGLVVAGAGSGKTSVMAARVVWLVGTGQVEPDRVLGLTFTNKAAAELAARIRSALSAAGVGAPPAPYDDSAPGEPVVSTYHAFAGRLVTEHGLRLGVEPRARLLADATRYQLAARVLSRHRGPIATLISPLSMLVGDLVALESELSEHLVEPEQLQAWDAAWITRLDQACAGFDGQKGSKGHCDELRAMALAARRRSELAGLVRAYRAAKADLDAIDFGDQVALGARLAETVPEVGALERERSGVVLLDEYQDTSVAQRRMLVGLFGAGHPVTAVGDPCQAIYGWRGASVSNLDGFAEHFAQIDGSPAAEFSLAVNQRSGGRLLALANTVAASLRRRHRIVELQAPPAKADLGDVVVALHRSWPEECAWVAGQVRAAVDAGTPARECAVLVRARSDFADLHAALTAAGLPVEVVGLGGLLSLPEVADVLAVLEVLDDPAANAALLRLLTGPRWRLGPRDLAQLGRRARELLAVGDDAPTSRSTSPDSALEEAVAGIDPCDVVALTDALDRPGAAGWSPEALQRITALNAELRLLRAHRDEPLLDLVHRVLEVTGLDVELAASPEAVQARRRESLAAFLDVVADFTDLDGESSLSSFLAFLRAADEHERGLDAVTPAGSDAVQLLTAHRAKGLEWDVVACPDLTAKVFPADTLRGRWTTTAAVLPGPLRGDADDQPRLDDHDKQGHARFVQDCRDHLEREERRLGYVAFTRARHRLIGSGHWWGATQKKPRGPSVFLTELRDHAEAGNGDVVLWTPEPAEKANPALAAPAEHAWPAPYEVEPWQRRRAAADAVLADVAALAAGAALPPDDLPGLTPWEREQLERYDREAQLLLEEERTARRGVREVDLPAALTASQLLRLQADPDGFARELARPLPRRPVAAARRGTRFHAWVESLFDQRPLLDPEDLPGAEDDGLVDDEALSRLKQAFLATPYAARRPHAVEAPFALPLAGRVVRGRIDAVYDLGGGRWEVVDWKTGAEAADPLQLAVYRLAWARMHGLPPSDVDAAFLYVPTGTVVAYGDDLPGEDELAALLRGTSSVEALTLL